MPTPRSSATPYSATARPAQSAMGSGRADGRVRREGVGARREGSADGHHRHVGDGVGARVQRPELDPDQVRDLEAAADAGDDAGGGEERLEDAGAGGDREAGERVLDRAEEVHAGQQHHDARRDDQARRDRRRGGGDADRDQRREQPAGHLLVEHRQPAPAHLPLELVDQRGGRRGQQHDEPVAAEHHPDPGAHHAERERHRPARPGVPGRGDLVEPGGRLGAADAAVGEVPDDVVDAGQVAVVHRPVAHLPDQHDGRLVRRRLLAHRQLGEHHVGVEAAQPARAPDVVHRRADVARARAGGQQQLADPQREVHGRGDLAGVGQLLGPATQHREGMARTSLAHLSAGG